MLPGIKEHFTITVLSVTVTVNMHPHVPPLFGYDDILNLIHVNNILVAFSSHNTYDMLK